MISAQAAAKIMTEACGNVTCFVPLDVRAVEVPVQGVGTVSVAFGSDPTAAVKDFLTRALQVMMRRKKLRKRLKKLIVCRISLTSSTPFLSPPPFYFSCMSSYDTYRLVTPSPRNSVVG
jgi:hypothetical protein